MRLRKQPIKACFTSACLAVLCEKGNGQTGQVDIRGRVLSLWDSCGHRFITAGLIRAPLASSPVGSWRSYQRNRGTELLYKLLHRESNVLCYSEFSPLSEGTILFSPPPQINSVQSSFSRIQCRSSQNKSNQEVKV